jgi:hypothetical protein
VGVVMDVALPQVLLIHVLVGLVAVREGRVIVLVAVAGDEVGEIFAGPVVVGDVHMVMGMHNGVVLVRISHCFLPRVCEPPRHRMPGACRRQAPGYHSWRGVPETCEAQVVSRR